MTKRRTPTAAAQLILINAKLYERERGKEITRYRFSLQTLRRIARRSALRQQFLSDVEDELAELGWLLVCLGTEYAVMNISKFDNWVKLSSKRLAEAEYLDGDEEQLEKMYFELFPPTSDASTDE
jgi:hypothetical protein